MGFMGLNSWVESDMASDFRHTLVGELLDKCVEELSETANECNTPGCINIALAIEGGCLDCLEDYEFDEYGDSLFKPLIKQLEILAGTWKEEPGKQGGPLLNQAWGPEHTKDIKRMIKSVKAFCKKKNITL